MHCFFFLFIECNWLVYQKKKNEIRPYGAVKNMHMIALIALGPGKKGEKGKNQLDESSLVPMCKSIALNSIFSLFCMASSWAYT